ncbi:flagellin N-terminal helical domain-containing protein [Paractinoplanes atraurantiacus]|uniref:Flagellin n=1 Tax=Paractinoplanes atraurantiacus TaxID=1036182 RepID=A0A285F290_9ACTN|nr:flagellin [Actinoplanes atraurantiacus]SNY05173.1 flagellin [Actinoplanes atraurantiacus]
MGLRINQNIAAQNAYRNLSVTDSQMSKSLEKLSSGFRINRAADDAAGLSISEGLRSQIGGLKVAVRNTQDGVSVAQTAEGSLNEVTSILQRMRDLSVQTANSGATDTEAAKASNKEMQQLNAELDRIGDTTAFGKSKLLGGAFGSTHKTEAGTSQSAQDIKDAMVDTTFTIDKIGGKEIVDADGNAAPITVDIKATDFTSAKAETGQDAAAVINEKISGALKAAGYQGNELSVSARTKMEDVSGTPTAMTSFQLNGSGDFETSFAALGVGTTTEAIEGGNSGKFQVGANRTENINISIGAVDSETLGTGTLDLTKDPDAAIDVIDKAIQSVSDSRASLGAVQNRFEHTINNLNVAVENLSASESRIRDTDMAQEMVSFTRSQILTQAGTSMLSQANQSAQNVLSLLR